MDDIRRLAEQSGFSGVVRIGEAGATVFAEAFGLADRAHAIPMTVDTQLGIASGSKALTALAVVSLIADGVLPTRSSATRPAASGLSPASSGSVSAGRRRQRSSSLATVATPYARAPSAMRSPRPLLR